MTSGNNAPADSRSRRFFEPPIGHRYRPQYARIELWGYRLTAALPHELSQTGWPGRTCELRDRRFEDRQRAAIEIELAEAAERDGLVAAAVADRRTYRDRDARGGQPLEHH